MEYHDAKYIKSNGIDVFCWGTEMIATRAMCSLTHRIRRRVGLKPEFRLAKNKGNDAITPKSPTYQQRGVDFVHNILVQMREGGCGTF